jgi:hypothetical protein
MKSSPAVPGGSLRSKPTWSNASGRSATSAFFVFRLIAIAGDERMNAVLSSTGEQIRRVSILGETAYGRRSQVCQRRSKSTLQPREIDQELELNRLVVLRPDCASAE